jgi:hypothetical protein
MSGNLFGSIRWCVAKPIAAWITHGDADPLVAISGDQTARDLHERTTAIGLEKFVARLVDTCLERLRRIDIHKCNIFVFAENVEGMTFWTRTGWTPRPDLSLLQVDLSGACSRKRSC